MFPTRKVDSLFLGLGGGGGRKVCSKRRASFWLHCNFNLPTLKSLCITPNVEVLAMQDGWLVS